jgi:hypothetical protein
MTVAARYGSWQHRPRTKSSRLPRSGSRTSFGSGGGGNRTRVRSRTGLNVYRRSSPFDLAPPAGGERPTAGASHPVVSPLRRLALLRGQPVSDAAAPATGRTGSDASPNYLGGECEISIRTYVGSRLFYEADRGPRPAAQPENRPRRDLVAPVCVPSQCSRRPAIRFARSIRRVPQEARSRPERRGADGKLGRAGPRPARATATVSCCSSRPSLPWRAGPAPRAGRPRHGSRSTTSGRTDRRASRTDRPRTGRRPPS